MQESTAETMPIEYLHPAEPDHRRRLLGGPEEALSPVHDRSMKITFLIRTLEYGGAERQLAVLAKGLHQRGHSITILTFYPIGQLDDDLRAAGVTVRSLEKKGRWDLLPFLKSLGAYLEEEKPDIFHGYLTDPNIIGVVMKQFHPGIRYVWGVRQSYIDFSNYTWLMKYLYRVECMLSRFADLIICNSRAGLAYAVSKGFHPDRMISIPNGIDTERFRPDPTAGERIRAEWNLEPEHVLIGMVGRLDPIKDHPGCLKAAARLSKTRPEARFAFIGDGRPEYRRELEAMSRDLGLDDRVIWAGSRADTPAIYNAFDVATLTSYGEGFPNVVGEAMACGKRCVVTDVGDCSWVLGDLGIVVPPKDPARLAQAWEEILKRDPDTAALRARERILRNFSAEAMVLKTEEALAKLLVG
jgi:glycosyltransferase involved in cell wall biosynthesis